jgi:hypothetical protein
MGQNSGETVMNNDILRNQYYNLPHELWARFTETLYDVDVANPPYDDFNNLLDYFRKNFKGYEILGPNDKKRLLNSLYKYYDLKKRKGK